MCETIQSSYRLRPAMTLVLVSLAPTVSSDDAGARVCEPLPSSPHFLTACSEKAHEFPENAAFFCPFLCGGGPQSSHW
jgi:hypothetical protein